MIKVHRCSSLKSFSINTLYGFCESIEKQTAVILQFLKFNIYIGDKKH